MSWWMVVKKFLKYGLIVAFADALPQFLGFLSGADGLSQVNWVGCLDSVGLIFLKGLIGGSVGAALNAYKHMKDPVGPDAVKALGVMALALLMPLMAAASTLAWDPNPVSENVVTYEVGVGTQPETQDVGVYDTAGATSYVLDNVAVGQVYYFKVRAVNGAGLKSDWTVRDNAGQYVSLDLTTSEYVPPSAPKNFRMITINVFQGGVVNVTVE